MHGKCYKHAEKEQSRNALPLSSVLSLLLQCHVRSSARAEVEWHGYHKLCEEQLRLKDDPEALLHRGMRLWHGIGVRNTDGHESTAEDRRSVDWPSLVKSLKVLRLSWIDEDSLARFNEALEHASSLVEVSFTNCSFGKSANDLFRLTCESSKVRNLTLSNVGLADVSGWSELFLKQSNQSLKFIDISLNLDPPTNRLIRNSVHTHRKLATSESKRCCVLQCAIFTSMTDAKPQCVVRCAWIAQAHGMVTRERE